MYYHTLERFLSSYLIVVLSSLCVIRENADPTKRTLLVPERIQYWVQCAKAS